MNLQGTLFLSLIALGLALPQEQVPHQPRQNVPHQPRVDCGKCFIHKSRLNVGYFWINF